MNALVCDNCKKLHTKPTGDGNITLGENKYEVQTRILQYVDGKTLVADFCIECLNKAFDTLTASLTSFEPKS